MSEIQLGKSCPECGGPFPGHYTGCSEIHRPPPATYDLAEFERQLDRKSDELGVHSDSLSRDLSLALKLMRDCLRASKREGKS